MQRSYIPWAIALFIAMFMLLDIIFVGFAQKTFTGLYTDNYYQKGVDFDKINRQSIYQNKTGWKADIVYDDKTKEIRYYLYDVNNIALSADVVLAKVMRPATHKFDEFIELQKISPGIYFTKYDFKDSGQWEIRIKTIKDSKEFITAKRIIIMKE